MIERRRREKMNKAFQDLRGMVPGLSETEQKGEFKLEVSGGLDLMSLCGGKGGIKLRYAGGKGGGFECSTLIMSCMTCAQKPCRRRILHD